MLGRKVITDKDLLKAVNQRLMRGGAASQTRVTATVQSGTVTVTGKVNFAYQRDPIVKAVTGVAGVRRVIDQLTLAPKRAMQ